jgi:hypothetical protein
LASVRLDSRREATPDFVIVRAFMHQRYLFGWFFVDAGASPGVAAGRG